MGTHRHIELGELSQADYWKLRHVGIDDRKIQYLLSARDAAAKKRFRMTFTRAQFAVLDTAATMKTLLGAKFTRPQAKVILELGIVGG